MKATSIDIFHKGKYTTTVTVANAVRAGQKYEGMSVDDAAKLAAILKGETLTIGDNRYYGV